MKEHKVYPFPNSLKNKRVVALDIETTGLSIQFNTIIELGVVEMIGGEIKTQYSRIFGGGRSSLYLVRNVHKIKDTQRVGKKTFAECAEKISSYLDGAIIVTHNGSKFDIPFIESRLKEKGLNLNYEIHYDTYVLSKRLKHEHHSLNWLCNHFGIPYGEDNHRGVTDCLCTLQLLSAFCEKYGEDAILK